MTLIDWSLVKDDFERDGALRDIYILDTTVSEWDLVLAHLRRTPDPLIFTRDGKTLALPLKAADILADHEASRCLAFRVAGLRLHCHFFWEREIEFDLDPAELGGPAQFAALVDFLSQLGTATGKVVLLTPENTPEAPILQYDPGTRSVTYVPPANREPWASL